MNKLQLRKLIVKEVNNLKEEERPRGYLANRNRILYKFQETLSNALKLAEEAHAVGADEENIKKLERQLELIYNAYVTGDRNDSSRTSQFIKL